MRRATRVVHRLPSSAVDGRGGPRRSAWALSFALLASACAGDASGLDPGYAVLALSPAEQETLCAYVVDTLHAAVAGEACSHARSLEATTVEGCLARFAEWPPECTQTVGAEEECARAQAAAPCEPVACERLVSCR